MAAPITTTATSLEGQLFEVIQAMQLLELAIPEAERPDQVTIAPDFEGLTATLTGTIPITFATGANGKMEVLAGTYL